MDAQTLFILFPTGKEGMSQQDGTLFSNLQCRSELDSSWEFRGANPARRSPSSSV